MSWGCRKAHAECHLGRPWLTKPLHLSPARGQRFTDQPGAMQRQGKHPSHWKAVEQMENNLPASSLLISEPLLHQPKPGSHQPLYQLQLGMEQAASLGAVLGAAPALHKAPMEKCGFHVLIHPLAQRSDTSLKSCRMKMWCGISSAISLLPCSLDYQRK